MVPPAECPPSATRFKSSIPANNPSAFKAAISCKIGASAGQVGSVTIAGHNQADTDEALAAALDLGIDDRGGQTF